MSHFMNIYDVSSRAGVSIATVSRVMNNNSKVSPKTREKVIKAMNELSYTPNVFARGLGLNSMNAIGIMCSDCSDPFLSNAVYYIEQSLRKYGYDTILCCTGFELANKQNDLKLLLSKRVDAIVMVGSSMVEVTPKDNAYIFEAANEIPIMIMNGYLSHPNIYCTLCDDFQAIYDVTTKMILHGRTKLMYLYDAKSFSSQQKLKGFLDAIKDNDFPISNTSHTICPKDIDSTKNLLTDIYTNFKFDTVICAEDCLAVGAVKFAKKHCLHIPNDIFIIGYNNSLLATCCDPELTSVDNHVEALCTATITTLMGVLTNGTGTFSNKVILSNHLVLRDTTLF